MNEEKEIIEEFIVECQEHIASVENDLLEIEQDVRSNCSVNMDKMNRLFRAIHSVKGGAGCLGLTTIANLTHAQENVLDNVRKEKISLTENMVTILLDTIDTLKALLEDFEKSETVDIQKEVSQLEKIADHSSFEIIDTEDLHESRSEPLHVRLPLSQDLFPLPQSLVKMYLTSGHFFYILSFNIENAKEEVSVEDLKDWLEQVEKAGEIHYRSHSLENMDKPPSYFELIFTSVIEPNYAELLLDSHCSEIGYINHFFDQDEDKERYSVLQQNSDSSSLEKEISSSAKKEEIKPSKSTQTSSKKAAPASDNKSRSSEKQSGPEISPGSQNIKVKVAVLDNLMMHTEELVLTRNYLLQIASSNAYEKLAEVSKNLDAITSNLQTVVMTTRMQSLEMIFQKLQRVVRDLSVSCSKKVCLNIEGKDVELDKSIIHSIGDPLVHIIRNAIDHGLESPEERIENQKEETGQLHLRAFHKSGHVVMEIEDDGRGVDHEKVREKAVEKGLISQADAERMSPQDLVQLLFSPGFSMAEKVTDISGRGVGMDVVLSNFTKLGGVVSIDTQLGEGTKISITLPLTLAIIHSLIISHEKDNYVIPQNNIVEILLISKEKQEKYIQDINGEIVLHLRGEVFPIVPIERILHFSEEKAEDPSIEESLEEGQFYYIILVQAGGNTYGIKVKSILDSEEIVIKPLGKFFLSCKQYAGATIQGDGSIALILDILSISEMTKLNQREKKLTYEQNSTAHSIPKGERQSLLITRNGHDNFCFPLDLITRIESVPQDQLYRLGKYRNVVLNQQNIPVFFIEDVASVSPCDSKNMIRLLIHKIDSQEIAVAVEEVVDIFESRIHFDHTFDQTGIVGSTIIKDKPTMLVDSFQIIKAIAPEILHGGQVDDKEEHSGNILVVDDSSFYRKHIGDFLVKNGYTVTLSEDGQDALDKVLDNHKNFDLIITDIEMPHLNGFELTKKIRSNPNEGICNKPIIAITSLAGDEDRKHGLSVGVNAYLVKLDKKKMLATTKKYMPV